MIARFPDSVMLAFYNPNTQPVQAGTGRVRFVTRMSLAETPWPSGWFRLRRATREGGR